MGPSRISCAWSSLAVFGVLVFGTGLLVAQQPRRLVLISVDGLRADVVTDDRMPRLAALAAVGVTASNAVCDLPVATLPNHATMLTGLTASRHGLLLNFDLPGLIPQRTLMNYAHDAGLRCGFYATKSKLAFLADPSACEVIDIVGDTEPVVERLLDRLDAGGLDVIFLHIRDPDSVGHAEGWLSEPYFEAVAFADEQIGRVIDAVSADTARDTYILVTADHGGEGRTHAVNIPANRRIPWIAHGPTVRVGVTLTEPVSVADTLPTALLLLQLPVPTGLSGRALEQLEDMDVAAQERAPVAPIGPACMVLPLLALLVLCVRRPSSWFA